MSESDGGDMRSSVKVPFIDCVGGKHYIRSHFYLSSKDEYVTQKIEKFPDSPPDIPSWVDAFFQLDIFMLVTPSKYGVAVHHSSGRVGSYFKKREHAVRYAELVRACMDGAYPDFEAFTAELGLV